MLKKQRGISLFVFPYGNTKRDIPLCVSIGKNNKPKKAKIFRRKKQ